jgi:hypothetical protein
METSGGAGQKRARRMKIIPRIISTRVQAAAMILKNHSLEDLGSVALFSSLTTRGVVSWEADPTKERYARIKVTILMNMSDK